MTGSALGSSGPGMSTSSPGCPERNRSRRQAGAGSDRPCGYRLRRDAERREEGEIVGLVHPVGAGAVGELGRRALAGAVDTVEVDQHLVGPAAGVAAQGGMRA